MNCKILLHMDKDTVEKVDIIAKQAGFESRSLFCRQAIELLAKLIQEERIMMTCSGLKVLPAPVNFADPPSHHNTLGYVYTGENLPNGTATLQDGIGRLEQLT